LDDESISIEASKTHRNQKQSRQSNEDTDDPEDESATYYVTSLSLCQISQNSIFGYKGTFSAGTIYHRSIFFPNSFTATFEHTDIHLWQRKLGTYLTFHFQLRWKKNLILTIMKIYFHGQITILKSKLIQ
jgi:hypothetical protein